MNETTLIQLTISLVGIIAAIISAALSYFFTKKIKLDSEERRLKETYYIEYIKAVSNIVISNNSEKSRDLLADKQNRLLLIGSAEVVSALLIFHDYIKPSSQEINGFDVGIYDELLTNLLKAMRQDLYKSNKINIGYPIIHLTGKAKK